MPTRAVIAALPVAASAAFAQPLIQEPFEGPPHPYSGFTVNGQQMIFEREDAGSFMGVPYLDFEGISLRNETPGSPILGDLSRHAGALRFSVEIRVYQLDNWFGQPLDPHNFPVTIQFFDDGVPGNFADDVSVYFTGAGMPRPDEGWVTFTFEIPDPAQAALPQGWGGTGDEDPRTGEPRLPATRTYASVLRSVDRFAVTTFRPGWLYSSNFWRAGFDNVLFERPAPACDPDMNADGNADQDDVAYLVNVIAGGPNPAGADPDFNRDGNADQDDYRALVSVIAGGPCP